MKKPQYTRNPMRETFAQWRNNPEYLVLARGNSLRALEEELYFARRMLHPHEMYKFGKAKNRKVLLAYKQGINDRIKKYKRLLKTANKELSKIPKPLNIFEHASVYTTQEEIEYVRNSPKVMEHIHKAFSEFESGPFKGLLAWYVEYIPAIHYKDNKPRLLVDTHLPKYSNQYRSVHAIYNRIKAYCPLWIKIINDNSSCYFEIE